MFENGFWVFGYGSLVWNPGFEYDNHQIARLEGYARSFCMWSIHHRGTVANPGLVLALDAAQDAHCDGVAFFVHPKVAQETLATLRERELISSAYIEKTHDVQLQNGPRIQALTYVIDIKHEQYCGGMALEKQAEIIAQAVGDRGANTEYLHNTATHLAQLGLEDRELSWLSARVRELNLNS